MCFTEEGERGRGPSRIVVVVVLGGGGAASRFVLFPLIVNNANVRKFQICPVLNSILK